MIEIAALLTASPLYFAGSLLILGLVVGSFLNVVIYRMPIMLEREWQAQAAEVLATAAPQGVERFNLSVPRSACPACKAPIKAWQNIPVLSWLALRGQCAACGIAISARYPLIELATGLLSAWVGWHFGFGGTAVCALILTWILVALTGIDIDHQLLPDALTLPLMWLGLLAAAFLGPTAGLALPVSTTDAIIGASAGYMSLWLVYQLFKAVTGKEGMGYGDFKLFAALGAWMGWKVLPVILLLSAATGAVLGILMIVLRGRDRTTPMPFGPYLAVAGWIAMMYGDSLLDGYMRISGLKH